MVLTAGITSLNPKAEYARGSEALSINVSACRGLMEIMRPGFGPSGTAKMLISAAGDIKITKDGSVLLGEMQIQHPTASLVARAASAQESTMGDGTTSIVLMIGELMRQADMYLLEGVNVRGFHNGLADVRNQVLERAIDELKVPVSSTDMPRMLEQVVRTAVGTKLNAKLAEHLAQIIVDAINIVRDKDSCDLKMIEVLEMPHEGEMNTRLVRGLVLDHGTRHPDMPHRTKNAFILTCNISFEFEKTEVNAEFFYKSAEDREKLVSSERHHILARVEKIVELKRTLCVGKRKDYGFVVVTQRGIDPFSLDLFAKDGIMALRRAKKRNMERLVKVCGALNEECLGFAGLVYEHVIGDDKFTFVEQCESPKSATILIKGAQKYIVQRVKDAVRDGTKAAQNLLQDKCVFPGAGAFEVALSAKLLEFRSHLHGSSRAAAQAIADAVLIVPKVIIANSGFERMETILALEEASKNVGTPMGVDIKTGQPIDPLELGIVDGYSVKKNSVLASLAIASSLLLVDEILRAGVSLGKKEGPGGQGAMQ
ncbi:hypothetical protein ACOME3_008153 [Neoechinorhynchus agilis]